MILDTHVLLWMDRDDPKLGPAARHLIEAAWQAGLRESPLDGRIALLASGLENLHRDPADCFIMATALDQDTELLSADRLMLDWHGELSRYPADA